MDLTMPGAKRERRCPAYPGGRELKEGDRESQELTNGAAKEETSVCSKRCLAKETRQGSSSARGTLRSRKMSRCKALRFARGNGEGASVRWARLIIKLNTGSTVYATRGLARPRHRSNPSATLSRSTLSCTSEGQGDVAADAGVVETGWHSAVMGHQRVH